MTTYPGAKYRPLASEQTQPRMARHDIVCLHTMAGYLTGTDRMFRANGWGGTESHFGVGGKWGDGRDGEVIQWQDTEFSADANFEGNRRIVSIETGDNAPDRPSQIEPWTPKQLDAIVAITAWACKRYDIPAVLIPDSKPGRRGIGYHRLGCEHSGGTHPAGFLQPGGERWSTSLGKECPGPKRIAQIPGIVARVKAVLAGKTEEENVAIDNADADLIWNSKNELLLKQSPAGALKTTLDRVDADNLQKQTRDGLKGALEDSDHLLTKRLTTLQSTMDAILARLPEPPA